MNLKRSRHRTPARPRGIMLIECLVYIAVLSSLLGLAVMLFHRSFNHSRRLQQNLGEISSALRVGEAWRSQARSSTGWSPTDPQKSQWILKSEGTAATYSVDPEGNLWLEAASRPRQLAMKRVRRIEGNQEQRGDQLLAQMTIELMTDRERPRHRPIFSFQAVLQTSRPSAP